MAAKKNTPRSDAGRKYRRSARAPKKAYPDHLGELEIVFTGLCSFLNLTNNNGTMPRPSVILPRTPVDEAPHIPFIAINTADVEVTPEAGSAPFQPLPEAPDIHFRRLDGVLLRFAEDSVGWPVVLPSYALLVQKDRYWPESKNRWDRRYVPTGDDEPDERVVAAYMHLGAGTIGAERLTDFEWEFAAEDGRCTQRGYFAQEVIYRISPFRHKRLTLNLRRLDNKDPREKYTFTVRRTNSTKIRIFIGNSDQIHKSVLRLSSAPKRAIHFKHLNDVTGLGTPGPIPVPVVPRGLFSADELDPRPSNLGGGSDTGYCGPHNPSNA